VQDLQGAASVDKRPLDQREGERRTRNGSFAGRNRRQRDRRRVDIGIDSFVKLGWSVVDTEDVMQC
jgi:hypothetical protein